MMNQLQFECGGRFLAVDVTAMSLSSGSALPFMGGVWHGLFGLALHRVAPDLTRRFGLQEPAASRLYALGAPQFSSAEVLAGQRFSFSLVLFGEAMALAGILPAVFAEMGRLGFGRDRVTFSVVDVSALSAEGWGSLLLAMDNPPQLQQVLLASPPCTDVCRVSLLSPLRLKQDGIAVREAPSMALLVHRLWDRLFHIYGRPPAELEVLKQLLAWAAAVECVEAVVRPLSISRFSARQKHVMPLEGLVGDVVFAGVPAGLWPWLDLLPWVRLGGKVTFGLGELAVDPLSLVEG